MAIKEGQPFKLKTQEELRSQVDSVSEAVDFPIIPTAISEHVYNMKPTELRRRFPNRYKVYVDTLRSIRGRVHTPVSEDKEADDENTSRLVSNWRNTSPIVAALNEYVSRHQSGQIQTLRGRQFNVIEDTRDFIEDGNLEGNIEAPTGFGKTVLFGQIVGALNLATTIVVPTRRLVEQTYESLRKFTPDLSVGRVYSSKKEYGNTVTVTTYTSLTLSSENPEDLDNRTKTKVVIFDETHEASSAKRIRAGETFKNAVLLGFSATPAVISDERFSDYRIARMTKNDIHKIPLKEAVEGGYISPFSAWVVLVDKDISNVKITSTGNYDEKDLEKVINEKTANKAAVKFFLEAREQDRRNQIDRGRQTMEPLLTTVYASSVSHAQDLATEFQEAGVKAAAVWGSQNPSEQDEIMKKFENGEIEVVCSNDLLVRGVDVQGIKMVLNIAPTTSATVEKQRSGRGLRVQESYPDKHAIVADFVYKNTSRKSRQVIFADIMEAEKVKDVSTVGADVGQYNQREIPPAPEFKIDGLSIITDAQEVFRFSHEKQALKPVQASDLLVTGRALNALFRGGDQKLNPLAKEVVDEIRKQHPDLVVERKGVKHVILAVTNPQLFIDKMIEKGAERQVESDKLQETDFPLSKTGLRFTFQGDPSTLKSLVEQAVAFFEEEYPDLIVDRMSGGNKIRVVTDKDLFIQKMLDLGAKPRFDSERKIQTTDFVLAQGEIRSTFVGRDSTTMVVAHEVAAEIESEYPHLIAKIRSGSHIVKVVTDRSLFLERMKQRGMQLQNDSLLKPQDSDFVIIDTWLRKFFYGGELKNKPMALEVVAELQTQMPDIVVSRKNGQHIVTAVADKDLFIQRMLKRGARLKE